MKIRDVKTYVLEAPLTEPFAYSQAWYERRGACLVEIVAEDGTSGWGEPGPQLLSDRFESICVMTGWPRQRLAA